MTLGVFSAKILQTSCTFDTATTFLSTHQGRWAGQSKLTCLFHKGFGQALASYQCWESIFAIILLVDFPNLHCVICQVVMDDTRPFLTKHVVSVIPNGVEAKDLWWRKKSRRKKSQRKQPWIRISNALSKRSGLRRVGDWRHLSNLLCQVQKNLYREHWGEWAAEAAVGRSAGACRDG